MVVIDEKNKNIFWQDAMEKEMENVKTTLQIISNGEKAPNHYQFVNDYMILHTKMKDFHRKACPVAGSHVTHTTDVIPYSCVVTREMESIALTMAALNDLEVKAA